MLRFRTGNPGWLAHSYGSWEALMEGVEAGLDMELKSAVKVNQAAAYDQRGF